MSIFLAGNTAALLFETPSDNIENCFGCAL